MSVTTAPVVTAPVAPDPIKQHERLIDHFKRVYSIVAGLALTEACKRTLPIDTLGDFRLWMFAALFITLVPIFHGGDRSLDQKYLGRPPQNRAQRFAFMWDDYMLLLTAVLFVCLAESIPAAADIANPATFKPDRFYFWMSLTFGFDVFVLLVNLRRSWSRRHLLGAYRAWVPCNIAMCVICLIASRMLAPAMPGQTVAVPLMGETPLYALSLTIFVLALIRTALDYLAGEWFLFPGSRPDPVR